MVGMVDNIGGYRRHWFECFYWLQWMNLNAHQDRQRDRRGRCAGLWGTPSPCSPAAPLTPWSWTLAPRSPSRTPPPSSFTSHPSPSPTFPSQDCSHDFKSMQLPGIRCSARKCGQCFKLWHSSDGYISSLKNWKPSWNSGLWHCNTSQQGDPLDLLVLFEQS